MPRNINYQCLPYQRQFQQSVKPNVILSAGYGAGKTYALVMKMFQLSNQNFAMPGGLLCPTLKMFRRDVLPETQKICRDNGIQMRFNREECCFIFANTNSRVYVFHDEDKGVSIRGPNLAFMLINEVTLVSQEGYEAAIARVRIKQARMRQVAMSGTPESFNWFYEKFIETPRDDTDLFMGDMRLNKFITEDYAASLIASYDKRMVDQYVKGMYVPITGRRAAWSWDRRKHMKPVQKHPYAPIIITMDFNVDPMTATLVQQLPPDAEAGHTIQAIDEIIIPNSNTYEMKDALMQRLTRDEIASCVIYPDPAGAGRSTKVDARVMPKSDIEILRTAGFQDIRYKKRAPTIKDCLNAMNNLFDKNRVAVDPRCKNLIADFDQCTIKEGLFEMDKTNHRRTHSLDGFKNFCDYEYPIVRSYSHVREQVIR